MKQQTKVTLAEKKDLMKMFNKNGCTLNGKPAQIVNITDKYPSVSCNGKALKVSWMDIRNVMRADGNFQS